MSRDRILRKDVLAWCGFDFANSSYTTLITTVAYSRYFRTVVVGTTAADALWGIAGAVINVLLILTSPIFGAIADYSGRKKRWLTLTAILTVVGTALLAFVGPGDVFWGFLLYVIASIGFEGGYIFYNAFLPEVSTERTIGRISGLAWGCGFLGGLVALVACKPWISQRLSDATGQLDISAVRHWQTSFVVVAGFFLVFSLPTLLILKDTGRPTGRALQTIDYVRVGFARVGNTLSHLRAVPEAARFILAYACFFGGVNTVIRFSAVFAEHTFGFRESELVNLFILTNLIAVPGTIGAGWLADRIGQKNTLVLTLLVWIGVALLGSFGRERWVFWLLASGAAIGMGSTQAIGRSLMARVTPPERESEFFGFYTMAGQVGSIFSFLLFGLVSSGTGNQQMAVLWTVPFFVVGLVILVRVNEAAALERLQPS